MRTTVNLLPDAFAAAKAKAEHEKIPLGQAVSKLILQAIKQPPATSKTTGVFRSAGGAYGGAEVEAALD
jgi:hypothetical protein